ncbi:hypothetical protein Tco_0709876 [Tanacetum coccineum]
MPPEDDVLLAEEQPLHAAASPTAESPGYIPESDPEEDPEEDPADYPADRDDDDDEEEEEEHPAPADFVPPVHRMTARISIRDEPSISLPSLGRDTSPHTPLSSPLPQIPSPPPNSPTHIEVPESCLPLRKRVRFASPTPSREVGESSAAGAARQDRPTIAREDLYGFVDMVDVPPRCSTSLLDVRQGVNLRVTDLATIIDEETTSMYGIMEDAQDDRSQLRGRVNLLYRDRPVHRRLAMMVEREAKMAREAWGLSMDVSDYARSDVMSLQLLASGHKRQVQLTKTLRLHEGPSDTDGTSSEAQLGPPRVSQLDAQESAENGTKRKAYEKQNVCQPKYGDDSNTSGTGARRPVQVARECTYPDFLKCQPLNFKGTEGVWVLTPWFVKEWESVYSISNCIVACQVKFTTCTLQGNALTWWNSYVKTTTPEAAHAMTWRTLKKMMTERLPVGQKLRKRSSKS